MRKASVARAAVRLRASQRRRGRDRERGAAALEFALVLPLLLLLLFGIIAYGYMLSFRQSMSQAAAEGAREAAVNVNAGDRGGAALGAVEEALRAYGVDCGTAAMSCDIEVRAGGADCATECVYVELSYDYDASPLIPLPLVGAIMPDTLAYAASARVS